MEGANGLKLKTKYAAGMRDELEGLLGCPVAVAKDRWAKAYASAMSMLGQLDGR